MKIITEEELHQPPTSTFKIGDKVVLKPIEELDYPNFKPQEVGIGTILEMDNTVTITVLR